MKKYIMLPALLLAAFAVGTGRCAKKKERAAATTEEQSNNHPENLSSDMFSETGNNVDATEQSVTPKTGGVCTVDPCATITFTVDSTDTSYKFLDTITIDYGTAGCEHNGRIRK